MRMRRRRIAVDERDRGNGEAMLPTRAATELLLSDSRGILEILNSNIERHGSEISEGQGIDARPRNCDLRFRDLGSATFYFDLVH